MLTFFDEASMPPEIRAIYQEMKKMAAENEKLRVEIALLKKNQEALRNAINQVNRSCRSLPVMGASYADVLSPFDDISSVEVETKKTKNGVKTTVTTKKGFFSNLFG